MLNLTVLLSLVWALSILYGEWFAYLVPSHWTCSWPHHHHHHLQRPPLDGADYSSGHVNIAVIADPQLMDKTSLHLAPKSLAMEIAQFYTDLYMRRAFLSSILPFNPDVVLFLGDYFDGGHLLSDDEWQESLGRLRHIFNLNMLQQNSNIKVYYLSGNHDTGYSAFVSQTPEIIRRYETEFGPRNYKVTLGKVDFIAIDAQTLDGHPQGKFTSATWNFIKNVSEDIDSSSRVLLTHIPLYRPDLTPCGPHRSSSVINQRVYRGAREHDITYQNYITKNSTNVLLNLIKPALVISGHDHDQCTVYHMSKHGPVTEHTVGTVSWQQGNLYPSFMLLSVGNATSSDAKDAISTHLCFLPLQTHIYIWYLSLFAVTLVIIFLWPANEVLISRKLGDLMGSIRSVYNSLRNSVKEKNEDENCEYEEIWDAEGSMHLIKKAKKVSFTASNERNSMERGNAVMRTNIKKQTGQDVSINVGSDEMAKLPARANKSRVKVIIGRLLRALRALIIIAAVNVPIYVLLVFKDWIDK